MTPAAARVATAAIPDGRFRASGVNGLLNLLATPGMDEEFAKWADSPLTRAVRGALRDLAVNGYRSDTTAPEVQYGVTCGLQMAEALLEDPSVVFPTAFLPAVREADPIPDFGTSPDVLYNSSEMT